MQASPDPLQILATYPPVHFPPFLSAIPDSEATLPSLEGLQYSLPGLVHLWPQAEVPCFWSLAFAYLVDLPHILLGQDFVG